VEVFGLQNRIQVLEADATRFEPKEPFDLLISGTMHSGLTEDPMVQIFSNLKKYVREGGIVLPNEVRIKAALVALKDWTNPRGFVRIYGNLHHVVSPKWVDVAKYVPGDKLDEIAFVLPVGGVPDGSYFVLITSEVDVGAQRILPYESPITSPQFFRDYRSDPEIFDIRASSGHNAISVKHSPGGTLDGVGKFR
jgi:hypothetical protein